MTLETVYTAQRRRVAALTLALLGAAWLAGPSSVAPSAWFAALCSAFPGLSLQQAGAQIANHGAGRPATHVTVVSCTPIPGAPVKTVTTAIVDFPPLAFTGPHRHTGVVTAFVLEGTLRSQMEGSAAAVYTTGQTWIEAPRALHLFAENPDASRPAKLLALFVTDEGCGPLVIPEPS